MKIVRVKKLKNTNKFLYKITISNQTRNVFAKKH